jgi:signal transduction histidine kinase
MGAQGVSLRIFAFGPLLAMALTLVPSSLHRGSKALRAESERRGAVEAELRALNRRLEATVAERSADLQSLVLGLESFNRSLSQGLQGSLHGIAGQARGAEQALLQGDPLPALQGLPVIAGQARATLHTLAALLLLAHVGDAPLHAAKIDLRSLVQAVLDELAPVHGQQALARVEVAAALPALKGDVALLKPVLASLIDNAVKFTRDHPAGRVQVGAAVQAGTVEIFVRDNGVGFDAAAASRLFMPLDGPQGARFEGRGLGLSIARRGVERHGGRLWAEGRPGQGAEFRFSLPA